MMTLVALGITTAYVYSMYAFAMGSVAHDGGMHMDFFWELATLIVIMLLGHWIEMRAVMGAGDALKEMAELLPAQAHVKQADGSFEGARRRRGDGRLVVRQRGARHGRGARRGGA